MNKLKYDFSYMNEVCAKLIASEGKCSRSLANLKKELNHLFKDSECLDVLCTVNTDKLFFGAMVVPRIKTDDLEEILFGDKPVRMTHYTIELDSKLFNPILDIKPEELIAIILHEVGHVVNDSQPIYDIRKIIDEYCAKNKEIISINDSVHYRELLTFGMKEYIAKRKSIFSATDEEFRADEFVHGCGYGVYLEDIMDRIAAQGFKSVVSNQELPSFTTLVWVLQVYSNIKIRRIGALKTLTRAKALLASRLQKLEIENAIRRLNRITDPINENMVVDKYKNLMNKMKLNSIKQFDDDYFEFNMRARNLEEENDALYLIRQVNVRVSIIDEYLSTERLDDNDRKRWDRLLQKYLDLREKISNTHVYKNKSYGIFVKYPEIKENNY